MIKILLMKIYFKYLAFSLITIALFFLLLEGAARLITITGSYDYIERVAIQQGLKARKQPGEFRIFLFGESTMQGTQLFPRSTIKKWLELYLEDLGSFKNVTIINFGRLGVGSQFMLRSFKDTLVYKPDLVVFYSAHNNFIQVEHRDAVLKPKASEQFGEFMQELTKKSCFISLMKRIAVAGKIRKSERREKEKKDEWYMEEEKKFDPATDPITPGSPDFLKIQQAWERDIRAIIQVAQHKHIPVIFFESLSKYKDFKPFYPQHSSKINPSQLNEWQITFDEGEESFKEKRYFEAMTMFQKALTLDDHYAMTYFRLGQCFEELGDYAAAYKYYVEANDKDHMPIRAPKSVNQFYERLKSEHISNVYVIPTQDIFNQHSPHGLVDDELVADQLHPTMKGQALMAKEIMKVISENRLMPESEKWKLDAMKTYEELAKNINIDQDFEFEIQLWLANYVGSYLDTAEQYLKRALELKPQSIRAKSQLAWVYWKAKHIPEAKKLYQELTAQDPVQSQAFFQRHPEVRSAISD